MLYVFASSLKTNVYKSRKIEQLKIEQLDFCFIYSFSIANKILYKKKIIKLNKKKIIVLLFKFTEKRFFLIMYAAHAFATSLKTNIYKNRKFLFIDKNKDVCFSNSTRDFKARKI